ncbi:MAG: hypothetical protein Q6361_07045 [Candidatus Hermodarchaeota archaeon]|nr:hypothetical protein [Candidatus Hermodarchaeota archaeon]
MPTLKEYAEEVIKRLKREGRRGLSHEELRDIALELGWKYKTAHRRAYHVKTLLKGIDVIDETPETNEPSAMARVTTKLLAQLSEHHELSQDDLDRLADEMATNHQFSTGIKVDWREPIQDCIEILEGIGLVTWEQERLILNQPQYSQLSSELKGKTIELNDKE